MCPLWGNTKLNVLLYAHRETLHGYFHFSKFADQPSRLSSLCRSDWDVQVHVMSYAGTIGCRGNSPAAWDFATLGLWDTLSLSNHYYLDKTCGLWCLAVAMPARQLLRLAGRIRWNSDYVHIKCPWWNLKISAGKQEFQELSISTNLRFSANKQETAYGAIVQ